MFVNGSEVEAFGRVADNAEDFVPQVGCKTIPMFSGESGEIEIIYQYGNYVHKDGGYIRSAYLSIPQNMKRFKTTNDLVALSASGSSGLGLTIICRAAVRLSTDPSTPVQVREEFAIPLIRRLIFRQV